MRHYSLLKTIPLSFYSKELYRDVGGEWQGLGFSYLLMLISLLCIPFLIFGVLFCAKITLDTPLDVNYIINQIPEMHVANGEVSTAVEQPYYIRMKETGEVILVIDTTRPVSDWGPAMTEDNHLFMVVGKNAVLVKKQKNEKQLQEIPKEANQIITSDWVRTLANEWIGYAWVLPLIFAPFVILAAFIYLILSMLLDGILGKIVNLFIRAPVSYTDCVRLASVVYTPILVLEIINLLLGLGISGWVTFLVNLIYFIYALRANRQ